MKINHKLLKRREMTQKKIPKMMMTIARMIYLIKKFQKDKRAGMMVPSTSKLKMAGKEMMWCKTRKILWQMIWDKLRRWKREMCWRGGLTASKAKTPHQIQTINHFNQMMELILIRIDNLNQRMKMRMI